VHALLALISALFTMALLSVVLALLALISALFTLVLHSVVLALLAHNFLPRIGILAVHAATGTFLVLLK
jgi:hypothetical protein